MVASLSMGALAGMSLGTELSALRKRAVLQQFPAALVYGDSCVAKRDCIRSEEHTSELQTPCQLVCRLLLVKNKTLVLGKFLELAVSHQEHPASSAVAR